MSKRRNMLRLRLPDSFPSRVIDNQDIKISVWACNESGSLVSLAKPVPLSVELVSAATLSPIERGSAGITIAGPCTVDHDGCANLMMRITGRSDTACRIRISAKASALCLPLRREDRTGTASIVTEIPVCAVATTSFRVLRVTAPGGIGELRTESKAEDDTIDVSTCQIVSVELGHAASSERRAVLRPLCLRLFEQQMKIGPGFGSIVWDCAIAASALLKHVAGASAATGSAASPSEGGGKKGGKRSEAAAEVTNAQRLQADAAALLRSFKWAGARVLDLGTGTGLVGIAAACVGARVLLTDLPQLLPLTALNIEANAAAIREGGGEAVTAPLVWGDLSYFASTEPMAGGSSAAAVAASPSGAGRSHRATIPLFTPELAADHDAARSAAGGSAAAAAIDGMPVFPRGSAAHPAVRLLPPYDVVLASEVAYRTEVFPLLLSTLKALTRPPGAAACSDSGEAVARAPAALPALTASTAPAGDVSGRAATVRSRSGPFVLLAARKRACCELEEFIAVLSESFHVVQLVPDDAIHVAGGSGAGAGFASSSSLTGAGDAAHGGAGAKSAAGTGKGGKAAATAAASAPTGAKFCEAVEVTAPLLPPPITALMGRAQALSKTAYAPMIFMLLPR